MSAGPQFTFDIQTPVFRQAKCRGKGDIMQSEEPFNILLAKIICSSCSHKVDCYQWALDTKAVGTCGMTSEEERKVTLRARKRA